jgi:hypothetical protein
MRAPNEIDFWRGLALIMIFVDHIPGIAFESYTYQRVGISDAAEIFVFLAGWSLRLVVSSSRVKDSFARLVLRLSSRALTIYVAQVFIVSLALAMTAAGAMYFEDALILEWNNASAIFENPVEAQLAIVLLSHQLGYFDILPLYVVLMAFAPLVVALDRLGGWVLLGCSLAVYIIAIVSGFNLPTWPNEGKWYFNPLCWQLDFVLGFLISRKDGIAAQVYRHRSIARLVALPVVVAGAIIAYLRWYPDPFSVPEPRLAFMFDKTFLSPARVLHMLSMIAVFGGFFTLFRPWIRPLADFASMMGRNSLNVFCVASILSLAAQFVRYATDASFTVDLLVFLCGIAGMAATAWISEWRERIK